MQIIHLVMVYIEYLSLLKSDFEFATLDTKKGSKDNYNQYPHAHSPVPYHLYESRGFNFLNIH